MVLCNRLNGDNLRGQQVGVFPVIEDQEQVRDVLSAILIQDGPAVETATGEWLRVEKFIWKKVKLDITSTYCPECAEKVQAKIAEEFPNGYLKNHMPIYCVSSLPTKT